MDERIVNFLAGACALAFLVAGVHFMKFWRKTRDRLFLAFAIAFWLLMLNQILTVFLGTSNESSGSVYLLRVLGFILILAAIIDKNAFQKRRR